MKPLIVMTENKMGTGISDLIYALLQGARRTDNGAAGVKKSI